MWLPGIDLVDENFRLVKAYLGNSYYTYLAAWAARCFKQYHIYLVTSDQCPTVIISTACREHMLNANDGVTRSKPSCTPGHLPHTSSRALADLLADYCALVITNSLSHMNTLTPHVQQLISTPQLPSTIEKG